MVTKNKGGQEGDSKSAPLWHCGDRGPIQIWTCRFSVHNLFPLPLATAQIIGNVSTNRRSAANFFTFLYIGADVFISWIGVADRICRMNIRFTCHRLIKKLIICANTIGAVITERNILTPIRLFVVTMPIQKAVASGNGNIEFYIESTRSNQKQPPVATMADRIWFTASLPSTVIFRYHLPLNLTRVKGRW